MWKIAIAVMLLATSAFAAADLTLSVTGASGPVIVGPTTGGVQEITVNMSKGETFTLNFGVAPTDGVAISAMNIALYGNAGKGAITPGVFVATGRAVDPANTILTDPYYTGTFPKALEAMVPNDFGYGSADFTQGLTGNTPIVSYTVQVLPDPAGQTLFLAPHWGTTEFDEGDTPTAYLVTVVTPEPASMLLLAVGAAFFARRRRA